MQHMHEAFFSLKIDVLPEGPQSFVKNTTHVVVTGIYIF